MWPTTAPRLHELVDAAEAVPCRAVQQGRRAGCPRCRRGCLQGSEQTAADAVPADHGEDRLFELEPRTTGIELGGVRPPSHQVSFVGIRTR
jgi:hypothetical protein